jgi:hypothetical protein
MKQLIVPRKGEKDSVPELADGSNRYFFSPQMDDSVFHFRTSQHIPIVK